MRTESELSESITHGTQAEMILSHPLFVAATGLLRNLTIEKFENLSFKDVEQMQECNIRLNLIEELEINLTTIINSGNTAFKTLEDIQTFNQEMNNER